MNKQFVIGETVEMPEPNGDDIWIFGGFYATIRDVLDNGNLIVEDQDSDFFEIEPERAIKVEE